MVIDIAGADWSIDSRGVWLHLSVKSRKEATEVTEKIKGSNEAYTADIKPLKRKRSLNANNYMWNLCNELATVLNITKEEVYRKAIKDVGIFKDFNGLSTSDSATLKVAWERLGTGWFTEQVDYDENGNDVVLRCYYGSSVYSTKQMSRLIDYIVEDCKEQGVETMTPQELSLLKEGWHAGKL